MQDLELAHSNYSSTTSFFINNQKILIRPLQSSDTFADFNINLIRRKPEFSVICAPTNWPSGSFRRFTEAEMPGTSIHIALSLENAHSPTLGLGMFTKNPIMRTLELGIIVTDKFANTRLGNELVHSLIREIKQVRPGNILTLQDDGSGLGKLLAMQCGMNELPSSQTHSRDLFSLFIDTGHQFETS